MKSMVKSFYLGRLRVSVTKNVVEEYPGGVKVTFPNWKAVAEYRGQLLRRAMDRLSGTELLKEIREELKDE